ncbi:MAG: hypothetical protein NT178_17815 [Proteobacteria bacterium]|nr:hypothetical protein [Pseudomonadota bacterium]
MPNTARKLNFLIEESVCRDLESLVPAGKRSRLVNEALRKELELLRRKLAVEQLLASSPCQGGYSHADILECLAKDRASH